MFLVLKFDIINSINNELDSFNIARSPICEIEDCLKLINKSYSNLKINHQNIRSVKRNLKKVLTLLDRSAANWDIVILTEY